MVENKIYHVYNRTNNKELLFRNDENRSYFLRRYYYYLSPYVETYCWCLIPNHFHFLIRVKTAEQITDWLLQQEKLKPLEKKYLEGVGTSAPLLERAFQQFFTSYAMAFNKLYDRKGNLFHRPFKRIEVAEDLHFNNTVVYIHANPVKHRMTSDFTTYRWSSWNTIIENNISLLLKEELFAFFGGRENMIKAHLDLSNYFENDNSIEE